MSTRTPPPAPFVVGVGRSGTTLLRLMLDAHPDLAIPTETHFLGALLSAEPGASPDALVARITGSETWPNMGMEAQALAQAVAAEDATTPAAVARAFYRLYAAQRGKARWGDKTPPYRGLVPVIAAALPEALFVHIVRDGRDVALSYRGLWFGRGDDVEAQARFWVSEIERTRRLCEAADAVEIRYEDLVADPARVLTALCARLDLAFDPLMLDYHRRAPERMAEFVRPFGVPPTQEVTIERFLSIHALTAKEPDASRIGRWRTEMTRGEIQAYERIAGPLLADLGYETSAV
ncbi:sulfotransferase [Methylorubrum sp. SB2]|uniref:sulfotransferase family protein n=1 Tax=Methylorubrum subtropicum TaxID=3138812 RepID=UPI00313B5C60